MQEWVEPEFDKYTADMIHYRLDTSRELIPRRAESLLAEALELLPHEVIDFVIEYISFISESDREGGSYYDFDHYALKDRKGFILFGTALWEKEWLEIAFTVAHEVAHAFCGHIVTFDAVESGLAVETEQNADKLAVKWLSKHFDRESLVKMTYEGRGQIKDGKFCRE